MSTRGRAALISLVSYLLFAGSAPGAGSAPIPQREAVLEEVPLTGNEGVIRRIVFSRRQPSRYYMLDRDTHAVRVVAADGMRLLGEIGNGPGELYYPVDVAPTHSDDRLYVHDAGNERIQILAADGRYLGHFPDEPKSQGLAVNRRGEVFMGQPATGHLITVRDSNGKKIRALGELISLSDVYGRQPAKKEDAYRTAFNRVRIAVDDEDHVWVAFVHAPLVYEFDGEGKLLAKSKLNVPDLSRLTTAVLQHPPPQQYMSQNLDGVPMTMVIKEIVFDRKSRRPVLLLGDDRIVFLRRDGSPEEIVRVPVKSALGTLAVDNDGTMFTTKFATSKLFRVVLLDREKE